MAIDHTRLDKMFNLTTALKSIIRVCRTCKADSVNGMKAIRDYNTASKALLHYDNKAWCDWHFLFQFTLGQTGEDFFNKEKCNGTHPQRTDA